MRILTEGGARIPKGSKINGFLPVSGMERGIPFTAASGMDEGPTALVISGVHGCEYGAISAAGRLASRLSPEDMLGTVIIVRLANPDGFFARSEYVNPTDNRNLCYCFPGDPNGSVSYRIAHALAEIIKVSDLVIDMHSGDLFEELWPFSVIPQGGNAERNLAAARAFGFDYIVEIAGSMPINYAASLGIPAVMAEMGGCGRRDEALSEAYCGSAVNCLRSFGLLKGHPAEGKGRALPGYVPVKAGESGIWIPCANAGDELGKGDLLGRTEDIHGNILNEYHTDCDGVVLYMMNSMAVNNGGSLFALGAWDDIRRVT